MGLSDEERIARIYASIDGLTSCVAEIDRAPRGSLPYGTEERLDRLKAPAANLWDCLLGATRNGIYWLFGGDAESAVTGPGQGVWAAAICALCDEHRGGGVESDDGGVSDTPFGPFDSFLSVGGLLQAAPAGVVRRAVFDVYCWTESLVYALRRYDDELLRGFSRLSRCVSDLQGACYSIFVADEVFGRAYVLNRTLIGVYGRGEDAIRAALIKINMHHHLSRPMADGSLRECIAWDRELLQDPSNRTRLVLALRIAGHRFCFEHVFEALLAEARPIWLADEVVAREAELQQEFDACRHAHGEHEAESRKRAAANHENGAAYVIHGRLNR